jgi:ornithine lipid ester-linked acyl 2-hydroxylase
MVSANSKPEFFIETLHTHFRGPEPRFFDKTSYPWAEELERNAPKIIESLAPLLNDDIDFKSSLGRIKAELPEPKKTWQGYFFYFNGLKIKNHLRAFPLIRAELAKIPNLINANIAVLEPNTTLLPHRGTTNGFLRCHLGLKVPAQLPDCGFIVDGEKVSWQEGKLWIFGDMNIHTAFNKTNKRRYILMLDVVRPEFVGYKKLLCVHQLSKYLKSATGDYIRDLLGIPPPFLESDPYNPEKDKVKIQLRKNRETIGQKYTRKIEDILFRVYKPLVWGVFAFKRVQ